MLALRHPPDFQALADLADALPADRPWLARPADRRRVPRRAVQAPIHLGVVPPLCDKLRLSRIPVSVFKPLEAGWATDLSTQGLGLLTEQPLEVGGRHWVRLDPVATRPTILPGRVLTCEPVAPIDASLGHAEPDPAKPAAYRVRLAFLLTDPSVPDRLGFAPERMEDRMDAVA